MQVSSATYILVKPNSAELFGTQSSISSVSDKENQKLNEAKNAVGVLKQARASKSDDQKNAARQKLELLRQQFQRMQMLGATPKQIAQMAGELARAVKDYAAAGGTPSEVQSAPSDAGAETNVDVVAASGLDETATDLPAGTLAPNAAVESNGPSAVASASETGGADTDKIKAEDGRRTLAPYEKTLISQAEGNQRVKASSEDDDDRTFYSAARLLAKQIKGAAQEVAKGMPDTRDLAAATKAIDAATDAVNKAEAFTHSGGLSLSA